MRKNDNSRRERRGLPGRRRRPTGKGFVAGKQPPLRRANAKGVEEMFIDRCRSHTQRQAVGSDVLFAGGKRADRRKRSVELSKLNVLLGAETQNSVKPSDGNWVVRYIKQLGLWISRQRITPLTIEKIAVFAPMPSASVMRARP